MASPIKRTCTRRTEMNTSRALSMVACLGAVLASGCGSGSSTTPAQSAPAIAESAAAPAASTNPPTGTLTLPPAFPDRPFVRVKFDELQWRPTEGNTLGVETAVVEGDPAKPGYYLTINHF